MSETAETTGDVAVNTDRELWREPSMPPGMEYYAPSIHVTEGGGIGIDVGGMVFVKPLREWHRLALEDSRPSPQEERWRSKAESRAASLDRLIPANIALVQAIAWYEEQARNCRKITREGDEARKALDADGGQRARDALRNNTLGDGETQANTDT